MSEYIYFIFMLQVIYIYIPNVPMYNTRILVCEINNIEYVSILICYIIITKYDLIRNFFFFFFCI